MQRISPTWLLLLSLTWWILAFPRSDAWIAGGMAVAAGLMMHTGLGGRSTGRLSLVGAVAFIPFFLHHSVRGGLDVARRALAPSLPLAPGFSWYALRLPAGPARVFFINCVSLLPGTFSADVEGARLRVHFLTEDSASLERLEQLEQKVAGLFALPASKNLGEQEDS